MAKLWIELDPLTSYMRVPGGVVIRYEAYTEEPQGVGLASSMVFVPCDKAEFERIYPERTAE